MIQSMGQALGEIRAQLRDEIRAAVGELRAELAIARAHDSGKVVDLPNPLGKRNVV
jgi:hypothetical protein